MKAEIARLKEDFRAVKPHTKKRVHESGNDRFARIKDIATAQKSSQRAPKRRRVVMEEDVEPQVEEVQEMIIHSLDRLRQLEEIY